MSTVAVTPEVQTSVQSAPPPVSTEVTIANTPAEIQASMEAERAAAATPAPVEAAPAPVATPEPQKPYVTTKNADGTITVQFMGEKGPKETFTGTAEAVMEQIANKAAHQDGLIRKLQPAEVTPSPAPTPAVPQTWIPDAPTTEAAFNAMSTGNFADVVKIGLTQAFGGQDPNEVVSAIGELMELRAENKAQRDMAEFTQQAVDFPWSKENTDTLFTELQQRSLPPTVGNLVLMHNALKGMGRYKAAAPQAQAATRQTPNPAPPQHTVNAPVVNQAANDWTKPLHELEAEIRAGRG
jgi:hypothetical protein